MNTLKNQLCVYSFYRFIKIQNKQKLKSLIYKFSINKKLKGTVLIANEGLNASLSGREDDLNSLVKLIKNKINIRKINLKINTVNTIPFNKFKVKLKNEIVSLGMSNLKIDKNNNRYIHPHNWDKFINNKNIKLIDTRNMYEIKIGRFKNSINPKTEKFREFPKHVNKLKIKKNDTLAIYCTGGIRCEKASTYLKSKGYKNVYQLDGGIINYLDYKKNNGHKMRWNGECFVFDNRVSINKNLKKGIYSQCYGCRHPITAKEIKSQHYKKGVYCPYCYNVRTEKQINRSKSRQKQIDLENSRGLKYNFKNLQLSE